MNSWRRPPELVVRNGAEVVRHLRELTPERSRSIGRAGRNRMLKEHTYRRRAEALDRIFQGLIASASAGERAAS